MSSALARKRSSRRRADPPGHRDRRVQVRSVTVPHGDGGRRRGARSHSATGPPAYVSDDTVRCLREDGSSTSARSTVPDRPPGAAPGCIDARRGGPFPSCGPHTAPSLAAPEGRSKRASGYPITKRAITVITTEVGGWRSVQCSRRSRAAGCRLSRSPTSVRSGWRCQLFSRVGSGGDYGCGRCVPTGKIDEDGRSSRRFSRKGELTGRPFAVLGAKLASGQGA